jgi:hypothetical protein
VEIVPPTSAHEIDAGVVLICATWSGPAMSVLRDITAMKRDGMFSPPIFVCDTDEVSLAGMFPGVQLHGWGEMLWIHQGVMVASIMGRRGVDWANEVRINNQKLLDLSVQPLALCAALLPSQSTSTV